MPADSTPNPTPRLDRLERANRRLTRLVAFQGVGLLLALAALAVSCVAAIGAESSDAGPGDALETLRVAELVVVDPQGVERVRIGGDLPDAVIDGRRVDRGADAAGVLLYDGTGQERGGYVTWEPDGNVGLTLDTRDGQVALFAAGPEGGATLRLWHGDDSVALRSDAEGSRLTAVAGGKVVLQEPAITMGSTACTAYRDALERLDRDEVLDACQRRYPEATCERCLAANDEGD